ncbi:MAG TPA: hypothetical protein VGE74_15375 [Gemmata sp.]
MSKAKKDEGGESLKEVAAVELPADDGEKEQVKLRPKFKAALKRVANDARLDMGELIEKYMARFITREDRRIAKLRLEETEEDE